MLGKTCVRLSLGLVFICSGLRATPAAATCCEPVDVVVPGSCVYTQGYVQGGQQGSAIVVQSTGSTLSYLMQSLNQNYTHSGMVTSWPYTVTHDDMTTFPGANSIVHDSATNVVFDFLIGGPLGVVAAWLFGSVPEVHYGSAWIDEGALYNGQPGLITQDISHGSSQAFTGGLGRAVALINPAPGYSSDINQYVWNMQYGSSPAYRLHAYLSPDSEWNKPDRTTGAADPRGSMCSMTVAQASNTSWDKQKYSQAEIATAGDAVFAAVRIQAHDSIANQLSGTGVSDSSIWDAASGVGDQVLNCFTYGAVWAAAKCVRPYDWNRSSWRWGTGPSGWYPNGMFNITPDNLYQSRNGGLGALPAGGRYTAALQLSSVVADYTTCQYTTQIVCHPGYCF